MDWGNAIVRKITKSGAIVTGLELELHLEGDFKKTEKKITWLATAADAPNLLSVTLYDYDYFITKRKLEEGEEWTSYLTPVTKYAKEVWVDANCASLTVGTHIQFERKGYFILDASSSGKDGVELAFNLIPDGRTATVGLKAGNATGTWHAIGGAGDPGRGAGAVDASAGSTMYPVKPVYDEGGLDTTGIEMYRVKPVY